MKKNNAIVYILALVASAFLLWLWYWLGFDHVDAPLDLVLSVIWWIVIAIAAYAIHRVEKKRQERVRTCYVAGNHVYNSEAGTVSAVGADQAVSCIHDILKNLQYGMEIKDMPEDGHGNPQHYDFVVRSKVFDLKQEEDAETGREERLDWRGEIAVTERPDDDPLSFEGRDQLRDQLGRLMSQ